MRRVAFYLLLVVVVLALASTYSAAKDETVDELKSRFESAHPEDRAELGIRIAKQQLRSADKFYNDGNVEKARDAVADIVQYSEKARDAATETKRHLKNIEIDVRKMAEKLRDIKRTLAFDDQPPVDQAVRRLEDVRTSLLDAMFASDKKNDKKKENK
jgi:hypothetical protein